MRQFLIDRRVQNIPRYILGEEADLMQVPSEMLRCVVFLCEGRHGAMLPVPIGTGFLVSPPAPDDRWVYIVTAAHIIDGVSANENNDARVWIRLNLPNGQTRDLGTFARDWIHHYERGADIAAFRLPFGEDIGTHMAWPMQTQLIDDIVGEFRVGAGDDVFIVGLFAQGAEQWHDIPIVRVGNIAAMPSDPIWLPDRRAMVRAYLIESRSTGGLSGSPVFVHLGHLRQLDEHAGRARRWRKVKFQGIPIYWMGIVRGHWDDETGLINLGIAVVIPDRIVSDVVNGPRESEMRKMENESRRRGPTADSVKPQKDMAKGEFLEMLKKASRRLTKPSGFDRAKKGT